MSEMIEIERKFLVTDILQLSNKKLSKPRKIIQGYLSTHKNRTVRVRVEKTKGFLTIKGKSNKSGTTRFEWEKEIDLKEAKALLKLCGKKVIKKMRYCMEVGEHTYELDLFLGKNEGLIVAEIELSSEDEEFEKPGWLGPEVTGDVKYYNSQLMKYPFKKWE